MCPHSLAKQSRVVAILVLVLFWVQPCLADFQVMVTVDTSMSPGPSLGGYLDFQFNPGAGAATATATVLNFSTDGMLLSGSQPPSGGASGSLMGGGSLSFINSSSTNEVQQNFTYGSYISFLVDLSIPAPGGDPTSTFYFAMFDNSNYSYQSLDGFGDGPSVEITVNSDGSPNTASGGPTVTPLNVPEPTSFTLAALWLACVVGAAWRNRRLGVGGA